MISFVVEWIGPFLTGVALVGLNLCLWRLRRRLRQVTTSLISIPVHTGLRDCECGCMVGFEEDTPGPWPPRTPTQTQAEMLPLRDEIIQGYRSYSIEWEDGRPWLQGTMMRWKSRRLSATCQTSSGRGSADLCQTHLATLDDGCSCGIYAHKIPQAFRPGPVSATCVLYGVIWPHTAGYRASEARIESLRYHAMTSVPDSLEQELCDLLALHYEVPCELVAWPLHEIAFPDQPYFVSQGPGGGVVHRAGPSYHSPWSTT